MGRSLFVKDALLVSLSPPRVAEGHLRVESGTIVDAGPRVGIRSGDEVVDRWGKPVLPGFVLAPLHLAAPQDGGRRRPLERREIAPRATLALLEALACGATAVRLVPPPLASPDGAAEEFDRAFRAAGVRGMVTAEDEAGFPDGSSPDPTERLRMAAARAGGGPGWDPIRVLAQGFSWFRERFGLPFGALEPGAAADLVFLDYLPAEPIREANLREHLLAISSRHVEGVRVAGRALYRRREPVFPVEREECLAMLRGEAQRQA